MNLITPDPSILILVAIFVVATVAESLWPLRTQTQSKFVRVRRNLGVAFVSMIVMRFLCLPVEISAAQFVEKSDIGFLNWFKVHDLLRTVLSLLLLDYTLYAWHFLNHHVAFLWRFHNAHHIDLDMDTSTATRFHFGELALSSFFRIGQIFLFGIDFQTLLLFETCVTAFALFHHANLRIPFRLERLLMKLIVAPRMHGIHHSIVRQETDSNFGTIFSAWDRIHRTLVLDVEQSEITIGVPSYRSIDEQSLLGILSIPFRPQRDWKLPSGVPLQFRSITK